MPIRKIEIVFTNTPGDISLSLDDIIDINSKDFNSDPLPYHYVIDIDGKFMKGRKNNETIKGHRDSLVIACVGGLNPVTNEPCDTLNKAQVESLGFLTKNLSKQFSEATIENHLSNY